MSQHVGVELHISNPVTRGKLLAVNNHPRLSVRNYIQIYDNGDLVWFRVARNDGRGVRSGNEKNDCLRFLITVLDGKTTRQQEQERMTVESRTARLATFGVTLGRIKSYPAAVTT